MWDAPCPLSLHSSHYTTSYPLPHKPGSCPLLRLSAISSMAVPCPPRPYGIRATRCHDGLLLVSLACLAAGRSWTLTPVASAVNGGARGVVTPRHPVSPPFRLATDRQSTELLPQVAYKSPISCLLSSYNMETLCTSTFSHPPLLSPANLPGVPVRKAYMCLKSQTRTAYTVVPFFMPCGATCRNATLVLEEPCVLGFWLW